MKPGPAPKPTKLKEMAGNPGHRPLNDAEPEYSDECYLPDWLPDGARAEWERVAPHLRELGLLTVVDRAAFAGYCIAVDQLERATDALQPTEDNPRPEIQKAPSGYEVPSGAELMRRQSLKEIRAFAAEFGFTPAQRSRIKVPKKHESKNPFDRVTNGK
jgi:P27 family predicted phage terminase small subunit